MTSTYQNYKFFGKSLKTAVIQVYWQDNLYKGLIFLQQHKKIIVQKPLLVGKTKNIYLNMLTKNILLTL